MSKLSTPKAAALIIVIAALILLLFAALGSAYAWPGNQSWWDTTYRFDYARITMADGWVIEGKVEEWLDWEDSDAVQVRIGGEVYYTHLSNVVLKAE